MDRRSFIFGLGMFSLVFGSGLLLYFKDRFDRVVAGKIREKIYGQLKERGRVDLSVLDMEGVRVHWRESYTSGWNGRKITDSIWRMNGSSQKYSRKILQDVFIRNGVDASYLDIAIVESGFDLKAKSHAGAVGPFQFTKRTGQLFGIVSKDGEIPVFDYRMDPIKSAEATAKHLKADLVLAKRSGAVGYDQRRLAVAAYNGSFARVYMKLERNKRGKATYQGYLDFMSMFLNKYLKEKNEKRIAGVIENLSYVMEFEAVAGIVKERGL